MLIVDPDSKSVVAYRRLSPPVALRAGDDLVEFEDIVPGFRCRLRDIVGG